ncbi:hypothetical protein [Parasitella parasitica]|uniref:Uncharacterized protein n=1 Tax=Parasitella parasitica TaxID=35722 RepID=A0A0B7NL22_9FUNG|nr:hypothetical protein [Parasitella parasitica]
MLSRTLGFERSVMQQDRNIQIDDYYNLQEYDEKLIVRRRYFAPGTKVIRLIHNKSSKMDSNYKTEVFTVVSSYNNGTFELQDKAGRVIKRRVNLASLRKINLRSN